jgi:predicted transcriptional regulator
LTDNDPGEMALKRLKGNEAVDLILQVLVEAGKPLTTREVQAETEKRRVRCPDSTVVFLNRLRIKGLINGERSRERKGWIWWVEG